MDLFRSVPDNYVSILDALVPMLNLDHVRSFCVSLNVPVLDLAAAAVKLSPVRNPIVGPVPEAYSILCIV